MSICVPMVIFAENLDGVVGSGAFRVIRWTAIGWRISWFIIWTIIGGRSGGGNSKAESYDRI